MLRSRQVNPTLATRIRQKDGMFYFVSFKARDILSRVKFTSRFYFEGATMRRKRKKMTR